LTDLQSPDYEKLSGAARDHGVILRPLGDVVVWMPPFSATEGDLQLLATATTRAIEEATDDLLRHRH